MSVELEDFSDFAAALAAQQYRCVSTLAAAPCLVDVFKQAGGNALLFDEDDARAIYVAIAHCHETCEGKEHAAIIAKRLLCRLSLYENDAVLRYEPGAPWCDESLAALFDGYPISPTAVRAETLALIGMKRRDVQASDHVRAARGLLWLSGREARA